MCGIAGSISWNKTEKEEYNNIKRIISALSHRGPDYKEVQNYGKLFPALVTTKDRRGAGRGPSTEYTEYTEYTVHKVC